MAAIKYNQQVRDKLKRAYRDQFGETPKKLMAKLHQVFADDLALLRQQPGASQRDLISDKTIRNFFGPNPPLTLQQSSLNYLCKALLGYDSYAQAVEALNAGVSETALPQPGQSVLSISPEALKKYQQHIQESCGQIRILDMTRPLSLQDCYVQVRVSEDIRRQRQRSLEQYLNDLVQVGPATQVLSRVSLPPEQSLDGVEAVQKYRKLILIGKAGSGKTTFLKYLAMRSQLLQASATGQVAGEQDIHEQDDLVESIPVYLALKDFGEKVSGEFNLHKAIVEEFRSALEPEHLSKTITELLENGRCLILLDALDEVPSRQERAVYQAIKEFVRFYPKNSFVVTCRSAAYDVAAFDNFTLVECTDFSQKQVEQFVEQWFTTSNEKDLAAKFLEKAQETPSIKELTTSPLFLTMLCTLFQDSYNFPKNRHTLYGDTVDALLRRWDATRRIERSETHGDLLTRPRKINLLSRIAYEGFNQEDSEASIRFLWSRWQLESQIRTFISHLKPQTTSEQEIDGSMILQELEKNIGLLVTQYRDLLSFPHLTFQEYFTARHVLDQPNQLELVKQAVDRHLTNRSWREVFLIIAGRTADASYLLKLMFQRANQLLQSEPIQDLLQWLNQLTIDAGVDSVAWRSFYLAVDQDTILYTDPGCEMSRQTAYELAFRCREYNKERGRSLPATPRTRLISGLAALHRKVIDDLEGSETLLGEQFTYSALKMDIHPEDRLEQAITIADTLELKELAEDLRKIQGAWLSSDDPAINWQNWADQLQQAMQRHLNIGHQKMMDRETLDRLEQYAYCCILIIDCLSTDSLIEPTLRENIVSQLLLPQGKIEPSLLETVHCS